MNGENLRTLKEEDEISKVLLKILSQSNLSELLQKNGLLKAVQIQIKVKPARLPQGDLKDKLREIQSEEVQVQPLSLCTDYFEDDCPTDMHPQAQCWHVVPCE